MPPRLSALFLFALVTSPGPLSAQGTDPQPPWRSGLMPWQTHAGQPRPWRTDSRFAGYVEQGYPDDVLVLFTSSDSINGAKPEGLWVTVTAQDSTSGLFLGILREQPHTPRGVVEGDNVVFRIQPDLQSPVAVAFNGSYRDAGWPKSAAPEFFEHLREGIRAYRLGNNGHNMPEIDHCIAVLTSAMESVSSAARRDEEFVGHYVLGRCLAEKYVTEPAIRHFRTAIALDTNDLDSHMA